MISRSRSQELFGSDTEEENLVVDDSREINLNESMEKQVVNL